MLVEGTGGRENPKSFYVAVRLVTVCGLECWEFVTSGQKVKPGVWPTVSWFSDLIQSSVSPSSVRRETVLLPRLVQVTCLSRARYVCFFICKFYV